MAASGRTKGGMNTKLHAVTYANGRPIGFFRTAGQVSDDKRRYKRRNRIEIMFGRLKDVASWTMRGIVHRRPAGRNLLRSLPRRPLFRHRPRRYRHLLALINGPRT
mgnify:CR=1 FL=1